MAMFAMLGLSSMKPCAFLLALLSITTLVHSAEVGHVKVVSDKVEDVSSMDAWREAFIKPGMTPEQKAMAVWESAVKFRHHDLPDAKEYVGNKPEPQKVYDAIRLFNVYGYCTGNVAQHAFLQLARAAGLEARHLSIFRWGVPEVRYNNSWHMYDVGMINYFPKDDGTIASVDEIVAAVKGWHEKNPGYHDKADLLKACMKDPGMKAGPALLLNCPTLQADGSYPLNYFGWYSTMLVYDVEKRPFVYEERYRQGYELNNRLRRGEKLTFNWSNRGLHVGMLDEPRKDPETLNVAVGSKQLRYTPKWGDLANSRIGNGTLEYAPPLEDVAQTALTFENLKPSAGVLAIADAGKPGVLVLEMPCSYVYLTGQLDLTTSGPVAVEISTDDGAHWQELQTIESAGQHAMDLQKFILRRYSYRLKLTLAQPQAQITALKLFHDFQHSQRALPALAAGENALKFSADQSVAACPVQVTYRWEEQGREKQDLHLARAAVETYKIVCAQKPTMKSLTLELVP